MKRLTFASWLIAWPIIMGSALVAQAADKVVFATNWRAQAAHGGFYQALADGT